jgi:hypothetical protein
MWKFLSFQPVMKRNPDSIGESVSAAPKTKIPGMVSPAEMAFFSESAARYVGREGAIVDLGCWMGATSASLAQGVLSHGSKAGHRQETVRGLDRFVWEEWMPAETLSCLYQPGDSFLPEARRVVRDHGGGLVELIQADLARYEWSGGPIKILLVDAMKNEEIAVQIARTFYPSLLTGSLLIHQDFKHYYTSWIHVLQYRLRQYFQLDRSVPKSGTVAFEVLAPIPKESVDRATNFSGIADDEIEASFQHSLDLVESGETVNIAAAHAMHYVHLKRRDRASEILGTYRSLGMLDEGEFPKVLECFDRLE